MAVAFTYTAARFPPGSSLATVVPETQKPEYRHIGPGLYHAEDPNAPTISKAVQDGYFPSMAPNSPRIPPLPPGMVTELQQPDMAHLGPGYYQREKDVFDHASIKVGRSEHSVFMHSPRTARIAETRTKEQIMMGEVGVRFDHEAEAAQAWSHGGRLPQSARFANEDDRLSPTAIEQLKTDRLKERRSFDRKQYGRIENIHKYGSSIEANVHDATENNTIVQMHKSIMLKSAQMHSAHSSVFNSVVPKFSKCPAQLLTTNQLPKRGHMGPGKYSYDPESIRNRCKGSNPSSSFASSSPRFRKRSRRELTVQKSQAQLVKEIEHMQKEQERIGRLY